MPPRVEHTWRARAFGRNSASTCPKKWPASVDLQASKKSKGLQEQQSQHHSNTPTPHVLAISIKWIHAAAAQFPHKIVPIRFRGSKLHAARGVQRLDWESQEPPFNQRPHSANKEVMKSFNSPEKRSNRRAEFARASSSILSRASRISDYRRQFPLHRRSSLRRFPRAPAWSTSAAN